MWPVVYGNRTVAENVPADMTTTGRQPLRSAPPWRHCGRGADPTRDPVGCRGRQLEPYSACLAHLTNADRATYLSALVPGSDLDHRGTPISESLLQQLLDALRDPATGQPCLGATRFDGATFSGDISFGNGVCTVFGVTPDQGRTPDERRDCLRRGG